MVVIIVLVHLEMSLVLITPVDALIKAVIIMKEIHSLAQMDATVALVLLDRSLVQIIRVDQILLLALMKEIHTMKEIHSLAKMDATLVLVLLDLYIVQKLHVIRRIAILTLIVLLVIIALRPHVKLHKVLALKFLKPASISTNQFVVATTKHILIHVIAPALVLT